MDQKAKYYIDRLGLEKHPEGGWFREIYRSAEIYFSDTLPDRYTGDRNFSTTIYFLLEGKQVSVFHMLNSDEIWHHIDGCPVRIYILDRSGKLSEILLGKNIDTGEMLSALIKSGNWFAAEIPDKDSFALVTCSVSPGFEYDDFTIAERSRLIEEFPQHRELILKLTRA